MERSTETPDKADRQLHHDLHLKLAMNQDDPDYWPMVLADQILGGDEKSRLWTRVREKEGLSYSVGTSFSAGVQEKFASFSGAAICAPQNMDKVETAFKEELARAVRDGFTAAEFEGARKELLDSQPALRSSDRNLMTSPSSARPATAGPCSAPSIGKPGSPR